MARYDLNVDFDNSITEFLYDGTGSYSFTVPASPNFAGTRYLVYLPAALYLKNPAKLPAISGLTRVEGKIPAAGEFRTIAAASYDTLLLKDAIEFPASSAGASLTVTNFYTVGSTLRTSNVVNTDEAQTIAGVKTFSSFPVTPSSAPTADYQVANKKYVDDTDATCKTYIDNKDYILFSGSSAKFKVKTIVLGVWDMDATASVSYAHGLTYTLIKNVIVMIDNDLETERTDITFLGNGSINLNSTNIVISRTGGGVFDSTNYDRTDMVRGSITIFYVEV